MSLPDYLPEIIKERGRISVIRIAINPSPASICVNVFLGSSWLAYLPLLFYERKIRGPADARAAVYIYIYIFLIAWSRKKKGERNISRGNEPRGWKCEYIVRIKIYSQSQKCSPVYSIYIKKILPHHGNVYYWLEKFNQSIFLSFFLLNFTRLKSPLLSINNDWPLRKD